MTLLLASYISPGLKILFNRQPSKNSSDQHSELLIFYLFLLLFLLFTQKIVASNGICQSECLHFSIELKNYFVQFLFILSHIL